MPSKQSSVAPCSKTSIAALMIRSSIEDHDFQYYSDYSILLYYSTYAFTVSYPSETKAAKSVVLDALVQYWCIIEHLYQIKKSLRRPLSVECAHIPAGNGNI